MKRTQLLYILPFLLLISSCKTAKQQAAYKVHSETLQNLTSINVPLDAKIDGLANTMISILEESLVYSSPKKTYKYIASFTKKNKSVLETLTDQIHGELANQDIAEAATFFLSLSNKDYLPKLRDLVLQLENRLGNKMKTFRVINDFMKVFKAKSLLDNLLN